jgi:hypothetical protein
MDPSPTRKGIPLPPEPPKDSQTGEVLKAWRHRRERLQREPEKGIWTHQRMSGVGCKQGDREDETQGGHEVSQNGGPTRIGGEPPSESWHQNVGKCRPQSDHMERSDLAKRFFIAGWERERAKRERRAGA